jgi:hypothetical protein
MQNPVVGAAKAECREQMIGIAHKVAIGKKHQLDEIIHWRAAAKSGRGRTKRQLREIPGGILASSYLIHMSSLYVSNIDISQEDPYTSSSRRLADFSNLPFVYFSRLAIFNSL